MNKISRDQNGCAICLSIDVDAFSPALYDGRETDAAAFSRGEFDTRVGVPRLLALLREIDVRATFFVPGHTADCFPEALEAIIAAGHEVGHHGYLHEPPARLTPAEEAEALDRGLDALERRAGLRPAGYRAPLWEPSTVTIELLEQRGFAYDSSLMGSDFVPYRPRVGDRIDTHGAEFGRSAALVEIPASWIFDDWSYFANARRAGGGAPTPPSHAAEIWTEAIAYAAESMSGAAVVFTIHPQVSGQGYVLRTLRRVLGKLAETGYEFVTLLEAANRFEQLEKMHHVATPGVRR